MNLTGEHAIPAPPERVWAALNDPDTLKACIPGCKRLEQVSDTAFEATVAAKVGPVSATFKGDVTLSDLDPPRAYTISGQGQGGAAGFAKGGARVTLTPEEGGTRLSYEATANVGGKLANVGSRLVHAAAKKTADDFFRAFAARLGAESAGAPAPPPASIALMPRWRWAWAAAALAVGLVFFLFHSG